MPNTTSMAEFMGSGDGEAGLATLGPIWLVGCGNMGRAMLDGWIAGNVPPASLTVINPSPRVLPAGVGYAPAPSATLPRPAIIVLAVKPARVGAVASVLAPFAAGTLLLSVLAGARLERLAALFKDARVLRALPNTPVRIRQGITLLTGNAPSAADRAAATALMGTCGTTHWIAESAFDAATAVASSSPAWLFRWIDALARAGAAMGLDPALGATLAREAVAGSATYARDAGRPMGDLAREVASPGGMTQAGLDALDTGDALAALVLNAARAAVQRAQTLAREAER